MDGEDIKQSIITLVVIICIAVSAILLGFALTGCAGVRSNCDTQYVHCLERCQDERKSCRS